MPLLDVEEGLDMVQAEVAHFERRYGAGDVYCVIFGNSTCYIGELGGPIGELFWASEPEDFEKARVHIRPLLEAIARSDLVVDLEVETEADDETGQPKGEVWYIEFVREHPVPARVQVH